MTTDRVDKLLRALAQKCVETAPDDMGDVLEERLGPLLRVGQEMSKHRGGCCNYLDELQDNWDRALATLEGRDGK